ncbi:hypothetical protein C8R46DRAFT_1059778 [Mycena filopes]|nr:hypothetical protein C8R46DRAFT_1059778 [Mycena filopes]
MSGTRVPSPHNPTSRPTPAPPPSPTSPASVTTIGTGGASRLAEHDCRPRSAAHHLVLWIRAPQRGRLRRTRPPFDVALRAGKTPQSATIVLTAIDNFTPYIQPRAGRLENDGSPTPSEMTSLDLFCCTCPTRSHPRARAAAASAHQGEDEAQSRRLIYLTPRGECRNLSLFLDDTPDPRVVAVHAETNVTASSAGACWTPQRVAWSPSTRP